MINSDWNSFRNNPKFFKSYWNLYPNQTVLLRFNPKKFFNPNQSEAHSKSIRINPFNPNQSGQYEWNRIFRNHLDWFCLTGFIRIERITSTDLYPNQTVSFRSNPRLVFNLNQSKVLQNQSELVIRMKLN